MVLDTQIKIKNSKSEQKIMSKETELIIKNLPPQKKSPEADSFTGEFY